MPYIPKDLNIRYYLEKEGELERLLFRLIRLQKHIRKEPIGKQVERIDLELKNLRIWDERMEILTNMFPEITRNQILKILNFGADA